MLGLRDLLVIIAICNVVEATHEAASKPSAHFETIAMFGLPHGIRQFVFDPSTIKEGMDPFAYYGDFKQCSDDFGQHLNRDQSTYKWLRECCEEIEKCDDYIEPSTTKYGITNTAQVKWLNCECDFEFRKCLLEPPYSSFAMVLGKSYFNIIRPKCFYKLLNGKCDNPFYDIFGNPHNANPLGIYHCVKLYEQKPFDYTVRP